MERYIYQTFSPGHKDIMFVEVCLFQNDFLFQAKITRLQRESDSLIQSGIFLNSNFFFLYFTVMLRPLCMQYVHL